MELLPTCGWESLLRFPYSFCAPLSTHHFTLSSLSKTKSWSSPPFSSSSFLSSFHRITAASAKLSSLTPRSWPKSSRIAASRRPGNLPETILADDDDDGCLKRQHKEQSGEKGVSFNDDQTTRVAATIEEGIPQGNTAIISACLVGLLTGIGVVFFNTAVHAIHDLCWNGVPYEGASWLREEPIQSIWKQVVLVPACGGLVVSMLNILRGALEVPAEGILTANVKAVLEPTLKTLAACVTLGTGNSLGPEGPSVEIGASISKGIGKLTDRGAQRKLSLRAAGSAAGIASGFNAAVAGCFFAVESVLWPSPAESSLSLTNTTSMVILSAVIASVVSEVGLGSEPAFTVPEYDFRSPSELPLYLLLGVLCGLVSLTLSRCTSFMLVTVDNVQKTTGLPKVVFPVLGGLAIGLIALAYPEILYWGFENIDILLESRPSANALSANLLLQLVVVKILATSLCRASGLVGGYYAPSLFIGAATGTAYGKLVSSAIFQSNPIFHLSVLEVASPQAYGLVGMAATLAGVCQVPLTAVLLLFELTQDYRIVLPLLGAVGFSSWITSSQTRRKNVGVSRKLAEGNTYTAQQPQTLSPSSLFHSSTYSIGTEVSDASGLCKIDSSLCIDRDDYTEELAERTLVSQAMRTQYVTVLMNTLLTEAVSLMLAEKQWCALIVDDNRFLIGLLTLGDIQEFSKLSRSKIRRSEELIVSELCSSSGDKCQLQCSVTPSMDLLTAEMIMKKNDTSQLPVISDPAEGHRGQPVGLLDGECINLACRALATRELLCRFPTLEKAKLN